MGMGLLGGLGWGGAGTCPAPALAWAQVLWSWLPSVCVGVVVGVGLALLHDVTRFPRTASTPSPPSLTLFDQSLELHQNRNRFLSWLLDYSRKFNARTWSFKVMFRPRVFVVLEPRCVEHVLKTNFENYIKGPRFHERMAGLLGDGIFNVDGPLWYEQRKISSHLFTHKHFKMGMVPVVDHKAREVVSLLLQQLSSSSSSSPSHGSTGSTGDDVSGDVSGVVDMSSLLLRFTLDSIGAIAFGKDLGSLRGESEEFVRAFDFLQSYLNELVLKPPGYALLSRYLTPEGRQYARSLTVLNTYVRNMVRDAQAKAHRKGSRDEEGEEEEEEEEEDNDRGGVDGTRGGSDLLSLFLARGEQRRGSLEEEESYLRDVVVNMTIAGRDTTAYALAWALHLLALHPSIQEAAAQEALGVVGPNGEGDEDGPLSASSLDNALPYLDALWTEVLRLYPSVPKNPKMAVKDDTLPDGTFVPKGAYVMYAPWVMGRLTQLWGDRAESFDPERHLLRHPSPSPSSDGNGGSEAEGKGPIVRAVRPAATLWPAFQAGPRTCLGQKLAYMEAKALLARLLATFRFEAVCGGEVRLVENAITTPMHAPGLRLRLALRHPHKHKAQAHIDTNTQPTAAPQQ